ncbi:alpha-L-fucosidase [Sphingobacterium nematocida]|uniref:alpha-L-fucosidase n=1 Tax=Sphingobacterium nematocida TaxID=1513896 RepID=A0A1T5FFQ0_9SPHI|nr:alpha-L-fucosidase [Sphingobacterium nematocida]SKB95000.1 alpha-L-fucosidase [Sphingobacterium nematocida]
MNIRPITTRKIIVSAFMLCFYCLVNAQNYIEIKPDDDEKEIVKKAASVKPTQRQLNWQKLEVTGFLHFGINTFTGKEWGDGSESPSLFNPSKLDTDQWVKVAKKAGINLLILTAKHHDGFCLWPTQTTEYSIKNAPYLDGKGDILKSLAESCKKFDMKIGVYLSPWDRNAKSYGSEAYNEMFRNQLTEVLSQYGKIDEVWFDGANGEGPNGKKQEYDWSSYYNLIRKLQPDAVIAVMGPDVRWVGTETGYGRETEWSVVPANNLDQNNIAAGSQQQMNIKPAGDMQNKDVGSRDKILKAKGLVWYPAETDVSIRPGWFYHAHEDSKVKSKEKLLDIYFHSVGKNGVLLLNIPPTKEGLIHQIDETNLIEWKNLRDQIFGNNVLHHKGVKLLKDGNRKSLKNDGTGIWTTKKENQELIFEYESTKDLTFNILQLGEFIKWGQRVEKFEIQVKKNNNWESIANGTTIGYKRIMVLPTTVSNHIRIKITQSRLNPFVDKIGLYHYEDIAKLDGKAH